MNLSMEDYASSGIYAATITEHPEVPNNTVCEDKSPAEQVSNTLHIIQAILAIFVIAENSIVLLAITRNWYNLTRQHNIYRYLLSLVVADLLYGVSLLLRSSLTAVNHVTNESMHQAKLKDTVNNLVAGVLHGSCFASLASASLLNLVLRLTCTRALARAAAIHSSKTPKLPWLRIPSLRSLGVTRFLIGFIWTLVLIFIVTPLRMHCHQRLLKCTHIDHTNQTKLIFIGNDEAFDHRGIDDNDCSLLRSPISRTYLIILNSCITTSWILMLICNLMSVCIKTTVAKSSVKKSPYGSRLTLHHSVGFAWDSSSLLICIITLSMTVSTVPYVVFSFLTEGGSTDVRMKYAENLTPDKVMLIEMTTYISSLLNPFIYMAMLSRLRGDVSRMLESGHKKILVCGHQSCCFNSFETTKEISISLGSNRQYSITKTPIISSRGRDKDPLFVSTSCDVTQC